MIELEEKHSNNLLNEALKIDVKKEIQKRFEIMLKLSEKQEIARNQLEQNRQKQIEDSIGESSVNLNKSFN